MFATAYVPRARSRRFVGLAVCVTALTVTLTGCARPVAVTAPPVSPECEQILASAPIRLLDALQRETSPATAAAIAWGDPPIVLVCGLDFDVPPDAQLLEVNGTAWVVESSDDGTVFTTADQQPTVQLRVPASYRPEVDALSELEISR